MAPAKPEHTSPDDDPLIARMAQLEEERRLLYTDKTAGLSYGQNSSHLRREEIDEELAEIRVKLGLPAVPHSPKGTVGGWVSLAVAIVVILVVIGLWRP